MTTQQRTDPACFVHASADADRHACMNRSDQSRQTGVLRKGLERIDVVPHEAPKTIGESEPPVEPVG